MRALALVAVFLIAGCLQGEQLDAPEARDPLVYQAQIQAREDVLDVQTSHVVRLTTDHGDIDVLVYSKWMPDTAGRFLSLVSTGFYDGVQFHRVIPGFVIQSGDPTGTGTGGSGTTIPHEFDPRLQYLAGGMGMARGMDLDSADSQWFITTDPATRMSDPNGTYAEMYGTYAMFGQVVRGLDVVRAISRVDTIPEQDRPIVPVFVQEATRIEHDIDPRHYPLRPIAVGDALLSMPLHRFDGYPFQITLETNDPVQVACDHEDGTAYIVDPQPGQAVTTTWSKGRVHCSFEAGDDRVERTFLVVEGA